MSAALTQALPQGPLLPSVTHELIETINRLIELLGRETALVQENRVSEIAPLQPEKTRLTRAYQATLHTIRELSPTQPPLEPTLRQSVLTLGQKLAAVVQENEQTLRACRAATDRLLASIVGALRQQRASTTAYSPQKIMMPSQTGASGVTLDRRL